MPSETPKPMPLASPTRHAPSVGFLAIPQVVDDGQRFAQFFTESHTKSEAQQAAEQTAFGIQCTDVRVTDELHDQEQKDNDAASAEPETCVPNATY